MSLIVAFLSGVKDSSVPRASKSGICNLHCLLVHLKHKPSFLLSNPWLAFPGTVSLVVSMRFYPLVPNASLLAGFHLVFEDTRRVQKELSSLGLKASGSLALSKVHSLVVS